MAWFASTCFGITRTTTLTCQRSQVGVLACLIAPTGRTRRDPDHLQLASFGAVLGTAPAGGPDASPTVLAALFRFPRWASLGPGPGHTSRHARLHHGVRSAAGETVRDGASAGGAPSRHRRPALHVLPGLVQRRGFADRGILTRRVSHRPGAAGRDVAGARLHQFSRGVGPVTHAHRGREAARGRYSPLQGWDVQLQPHAAGDLLASWRGGGVVEGVKGAPEPSAPRLDQRLKPRIPKEWGEVR